MKPNHVKQKLQSGGTSIGTFVFEFNTTGIGRIAAAAGAEFTIFDMEHTGWHIETIRMLMATTRSTDMIPLVRVPAVQYSFIAQALDMGAMGVMTPMVESAEQAKTLVASAKYPPAGRRGAAFGIAHDDYTPGDVTEKITSANRETLLIAQVETAKGVAHVNEIAGTNGIDVLWIGQSDLTNSLGIPGQFEHQTFRDAVSTILEACKRHNKAAGYMAMTVAEGKALLDQGFRMLAYSGDLWLYQNALREGIAALSRDSID